MVKKNDAIENADFVALVVEDNPDHCKEIKKTIESLNTLPRSQHGSWVAKVFKDTEGLSDQQVKDEFTVDQIKEWLSKDIEKASLQGKKVVVFLDLSWGKVDHLSEDKFLKTLLCRESHFSAQAEESRPAPMSVISWLRQHHPTLCIVPFSSFGVGRMQSLCRYLGANFVIQKFPKLQDLYSDPRCNHLKNGAQCDRCLFALEARHRNSLTNNIETLVAILHREELFCYSEDGRASCDLVTAKCKADVWSQVETVSNMLHLRDAEGKKTYSIDSRILKLDIVRLAQELTGRPNTEAISRIGHGQAEAQWTGLNSVIVGKRLEPAMSILRRVNRFNLTVVLYGPTGVGKSLIAQLMHSASSRFKGPFVELNCASAPTETLIDSYLFGHVKGAFHGANEDRKSKLEEADNGTLFINEMDSLPLTSQGKLLQFLEGNGFQRLGGSKTLTPNVRVIVASISNLKAIIPIKFRADLHSRIAECEIQLPGLAGFGDEICQLAEFFLVELNTEFKYSKTFSTDALEWMRYQPWEGNVRELRNRVRYAFAMAENTEAISTSDFQEVLAEPQRRFDTIDNDRNLAHATGFSESESIRPINEIVKERLVSYMQIVAVKKIPQNEFANQLGVAPATVSKWLDDYGIPNPWKRNLRKNDNTKVSR